MFANVVELLNYHSQFGEYNSQNGVVFLSEKAL
jgi:hypothetical protein